jgi:hypothetical protein
VSKKKATALTPETKRTRDIRNGVLLAHVVVSWVVIVLVRFRWWTVFSHGAEVGHVEGSDEQAFQTGYITLAAIVAFFFTSYDIVTNSDIQWPPLLASAFALGCAAEITYKLYSERDVVYKHLVALEHNRDMAREQEEGSAAAVGSGSVAAVRSSSASSLVGTDEGIKLKVNYGLEGALYGSFFMVLLSAYLTFFARREEP